MSAHKVIIPACRVKYQDGRYSIEPPVGASRNFRELLKYSFEKRGGFISATYDLPKRPRSTGKGSQNNHVWGHATQIATDTGNDVDDVMREAKHRAISQGYPAVMGENGFPVRIIGTDQIKGESSADVTVDECRVLIDVLHQIAAEMNITLIEEAAA